MRLFKKSNKKEESERVYKDYVYKMKELVDKIDNKYGLNSLVIDNKKISKNKIIIFCEVSDSQIKNACNLCTSNEETMLKLLEDIYNNGLDKDDIIYNQA